MSPVVRENARVALIITARLSLFAMLLIERVLNPGSKSAPLYPRDYRPGA